MIVSTMEGDSTYEGRALRVPGMQPWCGQKKIEKKRELVNFQSRSRKICAIVHFFKYFAKMLQVFSEEEAILV